MDIRIDSQGTVQCLYEEVIDLTAMGEVHIQRASHVEPSQSGDWFVDLAPVGGPQLGPFVCRSVALNFEALWLHAERIFRSH